MRPLNRGSFLTQSLCFAAACSAAGEVGAAADRASLLTLRDSDGRESPVVTKRHWETRRDQMRAGMERVMGRLPDDSRRCPLDVRVDTEEQRTGYRLRRLTYQTLLGERTPAILLLPDRLRKDTPAVLALHQTVQIGKEEPTGLGGSSRLHYGKELAERGYVVLAPDYPTLGTYQIDVYAQGWVSCSLRAIWDNMRAIDLLQSIPEVADDRIGCLGHSLGGHNTLFTTAFDQRIRVAATSCGFTAFARYYGGDLRGWMGDRYMPRIRELFPTPDRMPFDFHDVLALIAPRPLFVSAPVRDANFDVVGVKEVVAAAAEVYQFLGRKEGLSAVYPNAEHSWPEDSRKATYEWFDRWLKHDPAQTA